MRLPISTQWLILNGLLSGKCDPAEIKAELFDHDEAMLVKAVVDLQKHGSAPPYGHKELVEHIRHVQGKDPVPPTVLLVLQHVEDTPLEGDGTGLRRSILERGGATAALTNLTRQLSQGQFDLPKVAEGLLLACRWGSWVWEIGSPDADDDRPGLPEDPSVLV